MQEAFEGAKGCTSWTLLAGAIGAAPAAHTVAGS